MRSAYGGAMKSILIVTTLLLAAPSGNPSPGRFVRGVTNPWFPLRPGMTLVYRGVKDGKGLTRRRPRDGRDAADRGRRLHRRLGPALPARPARGAHDRLVRAGQGRERL